MADPKKPGTNEKFDEETGKGRSNVDRDEQGRIISDEDPDHERVTDRDREADESNDSQGP